MKFKFNAIRFFKKKKKNAGYFNAKFKKYLKIDHEVSSEPTMDLCTNFRRQTRISKRKKNKNKNKHDKRWHNISPPKGVFFFLFSTKR